MRKTDPETVLPTNHMNIQEPPVGETTVLEANPHYGMMTKALVWGAALFLVSLGWFLPPSNTHYTFVDAEGIVRAIDMISASGQVAPVGIDVGHEVKEQATGKGLSLLIGAALVTLVWGALVLRLNASRSNESKSLFPSPRSVYVIVLAGGFSYIWFILNIVDTLPQWLGGQG